MLDLYHVALKPQLCLLDCSKESSAAFGLNKLRLPNDSLVPEKGRCLSPAPGYEALVWALSYNFPGDFSFKTDRRPPPTHHDSARVNVCTLRQTSNSSQANSLWMLESLKEVTKGQSGGGCACAPFTKTKTREGGGDKGRETSKEEGEDNQELDWGNF